VESILVITDYCIHVKVPDDGPYETKTCNREIKVNHKNIDLESLLW
jgi:hypothetical protein